MKVLPDAVCWHEGMQLLPQHFQLQALRSEVLAAHFAQAANPWFWGVSQLDIDPVALCTGLVRIQSIDAILPDGLPVRLEPGCETTLELDISASVAASENLTVTVYLAVSPLTRSGQILPLQGRLRSLVGEAMPDLASGEYPEPLTVWRPNLRLVPESERADSICLPLLKISKEGGGFVRQPYTPPCPFVLPESLIGQAISELCARGREKCLFLAGRLRQAQLADNSDDIEEIRRQLAALWARLPEVEALLNSRVASPLALHGLLAGMAGSWCVLDLAKGVPAFTPLDYLELKRGFDEVIQWLIQVLENVRVGYRCLPFIAINHGFSIHLPDTATRRQRLVIGLRMSAGFGQQAAQDWLGHAVIASENHIATLSRQRMSGLPHQPMSRQEQVSYGLGEDTHLFVIQAGGEWFHPEIPLCLVVSAEAGVVAPWQVVLFTDSSD